MPRARCAASMELPRRVCRRTAIPPLRQGCDESAGRRPRRGIGGHRIRRRGPKAGNGIAGPRVLWRSVPFRHEEGGIASPCPAREYRFRDEWARDEHARGAAPPFLLEGGVEGLSGSVRKGHGQHLRAVEQAGRSQAEEATVLQHRGEAGARGREGFVEGDDRPRALGDEVAGAVYQGCCGRDGADEDYMHEAVKDRAHRSIL